ncbi:Phenylacetic acid degradation-related protein [Pseudooceanicola batsensis HTCC2597]|uniref:Phenylacetic acid degradation-related protein n=1 Tax=Pseudooceanicola batsensis (strain ATCC BAA-863 / DSM 15984 / KCTC 12145 / HTCC2597) TaxID=252305 RepID=A3TVY5_PSEBH|nr:PaaI family thioesterase [Pseudooceanicola batsensis]EAQ03781.1 Phenylacetic acid degradation-related protein [Pseudooceanicola batsensis HTCC2597]
MFDPAPIPDYNVGTADISEVLNRTGQDLMQGIIDGDQPAPSMARTMRHWIARVEEGEVEFRGEPSAEVLNPGGLVHGGWAMTLLDSALGCAVQTTLEKGVTFVSLDTSVRFVRPITPETGQVRCIGRVQSRGKRIATAEGVIEDRTGRVLATGTTSCFIRPLGH